MDSERIASPAHSPSLVGGDLQACGHQPSPSTGAADLAKYHHRLNSGFNLVPFAGLGILHANPNRGSGPTKVDRNDTSHFIPLGMSLEYQVGPKIAFSTTLMVNLHHITLSPPVPNDNTSVALLFGIRWGP